MKALIAMSGGVDSSVAALLTKEKGFECIGCTMKLYDGSYGETSREKACCSLDDVEDARSVAHRLGMPYYVFNFTDDFREKVIDKFVKSYLRGLTPNPCIDCNRYMKFGKLFERAAQLDCDYVVTGHYARIEKDGDRFVLKKARDQTKDQSYVLYSMTQQQLAHTMFPLGELCKTETRKIAEEHGFINADKPDSQDICFVPDGDYARIIEAHTGETPCAGDFISCDGKPIGKHKGIIHYTVGQRRGLGIAAKEPLYVCKINARDNTVTLGTARDLLSSSVDAYDFNWISGIIPSGEIKCKAKIRYRHCEQEAVAVAVDGKTVHIEFSQPQRAITPGQVAVLYDGDTVLGGGVIA